jgi:hypothetical protein
MSNEIETKLNDLAELRASVDALNLQKQDAINQVLTPEIRKQVADIEAEYAGKAEVANQKASWLEDEIREEVGKVGSTVKGNFFMAVYAKGRVSWDPKSLDGYAVGHPEILSFRKEGQPSVSIRRVTP